MGFQVGFTGTSRGLTDEQREELYKLLKSIANQEMGYGGVTLHHGDCVGADAEADSFARSLGYRVVIHPPSNSKARAYCDSKGKSLVLPEKPYLMRNQDIVDACDILIACPRTADEELRSGTWATFRRARKARKPVHLLLP